MWECQTLWHSGKWGNVAFVKYDLMSGIWVSSFYMMDNESQLLLKFEKSFQVQIAAIF